MPTPAISKTVTTTRNVGCHAFAAPCRAPAERQFRMGRESMPPERISQTTRMAKAPHLRHGTLQLDLDRPVGRNGLLERCFQRISINGGDGGGLFCLMLGFLLSPLRGRFREVWPL